MEKIYYTQDYIDKLIEELIDKIKKSKRNFSVVVGIENGGVNVSKKVAEALNSKHKTIKISHYHSNNTIVETNSFNVNSYDSCLICDDVFDSGLTAKLFVDHCGFRPQDAFVGIFWRKISKIKPDFYAREMGNEWAVFPWEKE